MTEVYEDYDYDYEGYEDEDGVIDGLTLDEPEVPDDFTENFPPADEMLERAIEAAEAYEQHLQRLVEAREAEEQLEPWADIPDDQLGEKVSDHLRIVGLLVMRLEARYSREKSNAKD